MELNELAWYLTLDRWNWRKWQMDEISKILLCISNKVMAHHPAKRTDVAHRHAHTHTHTHTFRNLMNNKFVEIKPHEEEEEAEIDVNRPR